MNNILVLGWYGKHNIGDESYKLAIPKLFPEANVTFSDYINKKLIEKNDQFIMGGGDIISPKFLQEFNKINKPKIILSVTANKIYTDNNVPVYVRDKQSLQIFKDNKVECNYLPDASMVLTPNKENGKQIIKQYFKERDLYNKVICVVINGHLMNSTTPKGKTAFDNFCYSFASAMDNYPASFLFVPFDCELPNDDRYAEAAVIHKAKFWKKNTIIFDRIGVQNTLDLISACDGIVSSRLHSTIFGVIGGIPIIDITHNHKNQWFLETIGRENWSLPYHNFNTKTFLSFLNSDFDILSEESKHTLNKEYSLLKNGIMNVRFIR